MSRCSNRNVRRAPWSMAGTWRALLWIAATSGAGACAPPSLVAGGSSADAAALHVVVSNTSTATLRVYLHYSSIESSLGTVGALSSRTFAVPPSALAQDTDVQIEVRERNGSPGRRSESFRFATARRASWTVSSTSTLPIVLK